MNKWLISNCYLTNKLTMQSAESFQKWKYSNVLAGKNTSQTSWIKFGQLSWAWREDKENITLFQNVESIHCAWIDRLRIESKYVSCSNTPDVCDLTLVMTSIQASKLCLGKWWCLIKSTWAHHYWIKIFEYDLPSFYGTIVRTLQSENTEYKW